MREKTDGTGKQTVDNGLARDGGGRFAPGNPGGSGRPAGSPNKVTGALKEALLESFENRGGVTWLMALTDDLYVHLLAKIIPCQVAADLTTELHFRLEEAPIEIEEVVVQAQRPLIVKDLTSSQRILSVSW
jgi:hypothetical protein